ncbi:MAG: GPR endopeptidase [Candidatus Neoclostridium sp.]
MLKTDLARELVRTSVKKIDEKIARADIIVDEELSRKTGKPAGKYVTVESDAVVRGDAAAFDRLSEAICDAIETLAGKKKRVLSVGLGNRLLTADALGSLTLDRLAVEGKNGEVVMRSLAPSVAGVTGIESYDVIRGVTEIVRPDVVFAVDSLCAAKASRIGTSFQLSDAGITPGSGVKNARKPLNESTLGVKVISIGVPMVVYASTITLEGGGSALEEDFVLTPKDVDVLVDQCARIIANAINRYSVGL